MRAGPRGRGSQAVAPGRRRRRLRSHGGPPGRPVPGEGPARPIGLRAVRGGVARFLGWQDRWGEAAQAAQ
eukprot:1995851-Lingulodinium_polyedra.AAC.1